MSVGESAVNDGTPPLSPERNTSDADWLDHEIAIVPLPVTGEPRIWYSPGITSVIVDVPPPPP